MTKADFEAHFRQEIMPLIIEQEAEWAGGEWDGIDGPLRREEWNSTVDAYVLSGMLSERAGDWTHPGWLERVTPGSLQRRTRRLLWGRSRRSNPLNLAEAKAMVEEAEFYGLGADSAMKVGDPQLAAMRATTGATLVRTVQRFYLNKITKVSKSSAALQGKVNQLANSLGWIMKVSVQPRR